MGRLFTKNRERLLAGEVASRFLARAGWACGGEAASVAGDLDVVKRALLTPRNPARSMDYRAGRHRTRAPINMVTIDGHGLWTAEGAVTVTGWCQLRVASSFLL